MTVSTRAIRLGRDAITALGAGLGGALVAAATAGAVEASAHGYWQAGYLRLALSCVWRRFDRWVLLAMGVAIVLTALLRWWRGPARPALVRAAVAVVALVALLRAGEAANAWRIRRGPNVLLVSIDTLRADRLGAYGYALPTSPTIDRRLAGEGVLFERVYSQSPKTTPSHMTMLTGLYPCAHGIEMWASSDARGHVLSPRATTLAEMLKNAGYATGAFTAGAHVHSSRGFDQGFDVYRHGWGLQRALDWIDTHRHRKWFLFFHTYEVHDPYTPPPRYVAQFDGTYQGPILGAVKRIRDGIDGWEQAHKVFWDSVDTKDPAAVRFIERLYDAGIRAMDDRTMTPLLDRLDTLDLTRDTLVVFTSDHGEAFGEHGRFLHDDLRGGTVHVPLIIRFPGRVPPGRRVLEHAGVIDVTPTILDLLGLAPPRETQGQSLAALARGGSGGPRPPIVSEYSPASTLSLRRPGLTYVAEGTAELLYDGPEAQQESEDRAGASPEALVGARAELQRWRDECKRLAALVGPADETVAPDSETVKRLRALGYVE